MNSHPDHDSAAALESLLRSRAARLSPPDPAWRETILAACQTADAEGGAVSLTVAVSPASATPADKSTGQNSILPAPVSVRRRWLKFPRGTAWGSLAACWLAVLALNHETRQLNTSANAGISTGDGITTPSASAGPVALAAFSSLPPGGSLLLLQPDPAILTFLENPRPRRPAPAPPAKRPPPHSSLAPTHPLPDPFV
jgi:hypothetical protein